MSEKKGRSIYSSCAIALTDRANNKNKAIN